MSYAVKNSITQEPDVRSMNQGKLEVVKKETARVNIDNLGISELKWTGKGEFNANDHYIYLRARIPQKKWNSSHSQQDSEMQISGAISKMTE